MGTFEITVCTTLCILFLLSLIVSINKKYDTLKSKWIAEGRKMGLERAKWNVEKVFSRLTPLDWKSPRVDYHKCNFLDAYTATIVRLQEEGKYIVLIKKFDCVLLENTEYFFSLEDAVDYVDKFRDKLLASIFNETI